MRDTEKCYLSLELRNRNVVYGNTFRTSLLRSLCPTHAVCSQRLRGAPLPADGEDTHRTSGAALPPTWSTEPPEMSNKLFVSL